MKIMFAPSLVNKTGFNCYEEISHYEKVSEIIDFISECVSNPEIDYFQDVKLGNIFYPMPRYSNSTVLNNKIRTTLLPKVQQYLGDIVEIIGTDYNTIFYKYFVHITNCSEHTIIFVGNDEKESEGIGYNFSDCFNELCKVIFNPYVCDYKIIEDIIYNDLYQQDMPFLKNICRHTNKYFLPYSKKKDSERNKFDFEYGEIVATRNKYVYNHRLSDINTQRSKNQRRRDVYVKYDSHKKPIYYISIDTEHGAIELFKHQKSNKPKHLGEYNFSCVQIKDEDQNSHKLFLEY